MATSEAVPSKVRKIAGQWLLVGEVVGVIGLRSEHGRVAPHLFKAVDELAALALEPHYLLASICRLILSGCPEGRLGIVARGCDERALIEMAKLEQIDMARLALIGLACSEAQARQCACARPYPQRIDVGESVYGVAPVEDEWVQWLLEQSVQERQVFWQQEFERCIKCYGCRNICPVCLCDECVLEEACWVTRGELPPELPFHLIRAYHIADKCIGCGECKATCPVDIPLTVLYALLRESVKKLFGYEPGLALVQRSPLTTTLSNYAKVFSGCSEASCRIFSALI